MGTFLIYLFKSAVCLMLFYLFYRLLLSKETFHRFNRIALLGILFLSSFLPLVEVTVQESMVWQQTVMEVEQVLVVPVQSEVQEPEKSAGDDISLFVGIVGVIYGCGVLFFILRNLWSLWRLWKLMRTCRREQMGAYLPDCTERTVLLVHERQLSPFSWLYFVIISRADLEQNGREILIHERAHIAKHHSWDLLLADCCIFVQWFNPAAWLLKQELQTIHEYEADESVIQAGINAKQYQFLIIKKSVGDRLYSMANSLNHSSLKKRITMMMKEKSNPLARLKYLYVLPVAAIALTAFARPEVSSVVNEVSRAEVSYLKLLIEPQLPVYDDTVKYVPVSKEAVEKLKGKVFSAVDQMPEFSDGGTLGLMKYIQEHLEYPASAKKAGKQGAVIVQFVVEADGSISQPSVLRSLGSDLDAAAIRIFQNMPKWKPGRQEGIPVPVKYTVPVKFKLPAAPLEKAPAASKKAVDETVIRVDGKVISKEELEKIDPSKIQSIQLLKDSMTINVEGEKANRNIIQLMLKKDATVSDANSANIQVHGQVVDEDGTPVIGAAVRIVGTKYGTVTDSEGVFTLQTPEDAVLQISYIGVGAELVKVQPRMKVILKAEKR